MELNTHAYNDYIASLFAPQDSALSETIAEMERESHRVRPGGSPPVVTAPPSPT